MCLSLALWNARDPILKERLFGLTNGEGNHGEDVKEHYYYLDATPTHSYLKMLYKYPQRAFPYADLVAENAAARHRRTPNTSCCDTGVFDDDRYFDVFVEYAQAEPERHADARHGLQSRPGRRAAACAAAAGVSQYLELEAGPRKPHAARRRRRRHRASSRPSSA